MSRRLSSARTLDNLKKEAKRWLQARCAPATSRRGRGSRARIHARRPTPTLRDIQHALAREHGAAGLDRAQSDDFPPTSTAPRSRR